MASQNPSKSWFSVTSFHQKSQMGWNSANRPKFLLSSAQIRSHLQMISRKHHSSNVATWSYNQNPSNILPYHHPIVLPWYPYITYPLPRYALTWRIYALPWRIYALTWRIYINTDTLLYMRHLNIYIYIDRYIYIYIIIYNYYIYICYRLYIHKTS